MNASSDSGLPAPLWTLWLRYDSALRSGLRKEALRHLDKFLDLIEGESADVQGMFALWVGTQTLDGPGPWTWSDSAGGVPLQAPLRRRVLVPFVVKGFSAKRTPEVRWAAQLFRASQQELKSAGLPDSVTYKQLLAEALELEPERPELWCWLFDEELEDAVQGTHHLSESVLVLPEPACRASVEATENVLKRAPDGAIDGRRLAQVRDLRRVLEDWADYESTGAGGDFVIWAAERGQSYGFPGIYYYGSPAEPADHDEAAAIEQDEIHSESALKPRPRPGDIPGR